MSKRKKVKGYKWIESSAAVLAGKPVITGTRISVSLILECLSIDMSADEIAAQYEGFPKECLPEVLKFAARQTDRPLDDVAA